MVKRQGRHKQRAGAAFWSNPLAHRFGSFLDAKQPRLAAFCSSGQSTEGESRKAMQGQLKSASISLLILGDGFVLRLCWVVASTPVMLPWCN
eukprot:s165_g35.t1